MNFDLTPNDGAFSIDKIEFDKKYNHLRLQLNCQQLIAYDREQQLITSLKTELPFVKQVTIDYHFSSKHEVETCFEWLLDRHLNGAFSQQRQAFDITYDASEITCQIEHYGHYYQLLENGASEDFHRQLKALFQIDHRVSFIQRDDLEQADIDERLNSLIEANLPGVDYAAAASSNKKNTADNLIIYGKKISGEPVPLDDFIHLNENIVIRGELIGIDPFTTKTGMIILSLIISDHRDAKKCKLFLKKKEEQALVDSFIIGDYYTVQGRLQHDNYDEYPVINAYSVNRAIKPKPREDKSNDKRIEFHLHTNMSAMDGITSIKDYIKTAISWGHPAIAITDHGVVQAFPDAMSAAGDKIKIIYGVEAYVVDDEAGSIDNLRPYDLSGEFVVFDIETTGFSPRYDGITEIGAIKVADGKIIDRFSHLVNPEKAIPQKVVELTGITDQMVADQPKIDTVLPRFLAFCGDLPVVAHNASFDVSFITEKAKALAIEYKPMVIDTLKLARMLLKGIKRFRLNLVAKHLGVTLDNHHRAVDDAVATAHIFNNLIEMLAERDVYSTEQLNDFAKTALNYSHYNSNHTVVLAKNQQGIKALYELISHSHIKTYYRKPLIPKSLLTQKRAHLLIGSACASSELFQAFVANKEQGDIVEIANYYDYLEIQPTGNSRYLVDDGMLKDLTEIESINRRIYALAKQLDKPCIATGDVHYLNPDDALYRRILMAGQGFRDAGNQPPLYFRTTDEMLNEFSYLGADIAREVVIDTPRQLCDTIDLVKPIPDQTYPPKIEGSEQQLRDICLANAHKLYGNPLPNTVEKRLNRELDSIIGNGYAVMYIIAEKLVAKSMEDGYLVGSRGSVGSSFAATMAGITEVNPLPPHYYCSDCQYSEFFEDGSIAIGIDLPDKRCPTCDSKLVKEGFDIPFETFLGFEGDKEPDIDLNFAGVYQATSHAYTEELFGEGYVYKAGTIGTVADKTAFGFVKKYCEENSLTISKYEIDRIAKGCVGVKRTTGQHPGGIMVVPHYKDVHDFTPIQYPANDTSSGVNTTHFDYHSISGRILKLDILGHDVPTIIRMLADLTGLDPMSIPLDDPQMLSLFSSIEVLNIKDPDYPIDSGTIGIPEFGTRFVRGMLKKTKPTTMEELVQISGLSHGTDVYLNNAELLIANKTCTLKEVIGTRDNIMLYLIQAGLPKKDSFFITESVRKGRGLKPEQEAQMRKFNIPDWYIDSCKKIKYMFPKAHAAAYVMMSLRVAYCKVYYPLAYYATYFTTKVDDFDGQLITTSKEAVLRQMQAFDNMQKLSNKEESQYTVLEIALEMYYRGFVCHKVDLYESAASTFIIKDNGVLPPLQALQGVGKNAAESIVEARKDGEFISINDIKSRSKANSAVIDAFKLHGILQGLPEDNQLSLEFFMQ